MSNTYLSDIETKLEFLLWWVRGTRDLTHSIITEEEKQLLDHIATAYYELEVEKCVPHLIHEDEFLESYEVVLPTISKSWKYAYQ